MVCPRCQRECEVESAACPHCDAPLLLGDDPPPSALDRPVVLDRRGHGRGGAPPAIAARRPVVPVTPAADRSDEPARTDAASESPLDLLARRIRAIPGLVAVRLGSRERAPLASSAPPGAAAAGSEAPPARPPPEDGDPGRALRWRRAAAGGIDLCVVALFAAIPLAIAGGLDAAPAADRALLVHSAAFAAVLAFVYETLAHYLAGATAGKHLLRLQVVGPSGGSPGLGQSAARAALSVAGAAALGVPVLAALFTSRGRPLHDRVAGTAVVRAP